MTLLLSRLGDLVAGPTLGAECMVNWVWLDTRPTWVVSLSGCRVGNSKK